MALFVSFLVGGTEYAVDIFKVREIVKKQKITSIPGLPPTISGITNLRGNIIAVLNASELINSNGCDRDGYIMVLNRGEELLGLVVDGVSQVFEAKGSDIHDIEISNVQTIPIANKVIKKNSSLLPVLEINAFMPANNHELPFGLPCEQLTQSS